MSGNAPSWENAELLFLAPGDVRKGRVEPIFWMQTCRAFAERGLDVSLVSFRTSRPDGIPLASIWDHFGIPEQFRVSELPTPLRHKSPVGWTRLWFAVGAAILALAKLSRQAVRPRPLIVYSRLPTLLAPWIALRGLLPASRRPFIVYDTHTLPRGSAGWVVRGVDLVFVNSLKLKNEVSECFDVLPERVLQAYNAPFAVVRQHPKQDARERLGLPPTDAIACHAGKLVKDEVELFLQATRLLAERIPKFRLLLVGGNPDILQWVRRRARELDVTDSLSLAGFVEPAKVELYLAAADVLLVHIARTVGTFHYATPSKSYDYMAAGRPIVATDLPLWTEIFGGDGERAIRTGHDPESFAQGVERAFSLGERGPAMIDRASEWVQQVTWKRRAEAVLEALAR
jgi:glycosyltransferase involved in cell wall biosynthesis